MLSQRSRPNGGAGNSALARSAIRTAPSASRREMAAMDETPHQKRLVLLQAHEASGQRRGAGFGISRDPEEHLPALMAHAIEPSGRKRPIVAGEVQARPSHKAVAANLLLDGFSGLVNPPERQLHR